MNKVEFIKNHGLTVVYRGAEEETICDVARAIYDGGGRILEIAFDPKDENTEEKTGKIIKKAKENMPNDMLIGAGTVITEEMCIAAYNAKSDFCFSPDTDCNIIKLTKKLNMVSIPGAYTPTEIKTAWKNGADIVKLFPATTDMLKYIWNITRPLNHIPFICTGGANENTIQEFIKAGACGIGTGISILKPELLKEKNYSEISNLTSLHLNIIKKAREKM